jgi:phosphocarrier protein HPr
MSDRPVDDEPIGDLPPDAPEPPTGMVCRIATICNQRGLHARAAARFVKTAGLFDAEVWVRKNGTEVSGRSIMGLMMLAAAPGALVRLAATGPQAEAAVTALATLIECKFDED